MKKTDHIRAGSLIIMVFMIMGTLIIILHSMLRCSSYLVLLARERKIS